MICQRIAEGESLRKICEPEEMPAPSTVCRWVVVDRVFAEQYARARDAQAEHYADEIVRIADEAEDPAKGRLQVDARKWVASKLLPKKYGDKLTNEHTGEGGGPVQHAISVRFVRSPDTGSV